MRPIPIVVRWMLPWIVAFLGGVSAWVQWRSPLLYPWPLACVVLVFCVAAVAIGWERISLIDGLSKMGPSVLVLVSLTFGFLLVEGRAFEWAVTALWVVLIFVSLELFFLLAYDPARYPVHALSRFNLALGPLSVFFVASTFYGLLVFLQTSRWITIVVMAVLGALYYYLTPSPGAGRSSHGRWSVLGFAIGAQVGCLGLLLPFGMWFHGASAALLFSFPLRVRRYGRAPVPSTMIAWTEGVVALGFFCALLLTARWA